MGERPILLVEDNPDDEVLTLRALRKNGLADEQVVVARDGVEALGYLFGEAEGGEGDEAPPLPRLVLLDLKLPRVDGLEVLRRMRERERTRLVPVVILTSSGEQQDMIDDRVRLADGCILRGVDFGLFTREMGRLRSLLKDDPPDRRAHLTASLRRCAQVTEAERR